MLNKLLPQTVTNEYRDHPLAQWALAALTVITIGRSLVHMFAADGGAQSIASITLDRFTPGGANTVITMFALWGLSQLLIGLLYALVLWRWQSLIPMMYLFFSFEYLMRLLAGLYSPGVEKLQTAPGEVVNLIFLPLGLVLLYLSLRGDSASAAQIEELCQQLPVCMSNVSPAFVVACLRRRIAPS